MTDHSPLPVGATVERSEGGWTVRLPLRREEVRIQKRTVVAERIVIRTHAPGTRERAQRSASREQVRVGDDERAPHDTLAGTGMDQDPTR